MMHKWIIQKAAFIAAVCLALSGCGFQPMYGEIGGGKLTQQDLQQIEIVTDNSRIGAEMQNALGDLINPFGPPADPKYRLELTLWVSESGSAYQLDQSITRQEITVEAYYKLVDIETDNVVLTRNRVSRASHDVQLSQFASLISEENSEKRATRMLSENIQMDLALYFKKQRVAKADDTAG